MNKSSCEPLNDCILVFKNLILDCLQRRALFEVLEQSIIGSNISPDNEYINFYMADYFRSQLTDIRKFFDKDKRVYKFSFLTDHLTNNVLAKKHNNLFKEWEIKFADSANKAALHQERGYVEKQIKKNDFNKFLDCINDYMAEIIKSLDADIDETSDFLKNQQREAYNEFLEAAKIIK